MGWAWCTFRSGGSAEALAEADGIESAKVAGKPAWRVRWASGLAGPPKR